MAIKHKRKSTTGYTWSAGDLVDGQIGLNTADGTLHIKKTDNSVVTVGTGSSISAPYVPLSIGTGDNFTVPSNKQILYSTPLEVDGTLTINGEFVEVNPAAIAVNAQVPSVLKYGQSFTVGNNKQVAFNEDIVVEGDLNVFGDLIDAVKNPTGVTPGTYTNTILTVDAYGNITYAGNGTPSLYASGSTYDVQRKSGSALLGNTDFSYDTSTSTHWLRVRNSGNFLATFGANNRDPALNTTNALFIDNTTSGGISILTANKLNNYYGYAGSLSVVSGSATQTSGSTSAQHGGDITIRSGDANVQAGASTVAIAGNFTMQGGQATYTPTSTVGVGAVQGGSFNLNGGFAYGHTGQPVSGGAVYLTGGDGREQGTGNPMGLGGTITLKAGGGLTPGVIELISGTAPTGKGIISLNGSQVTLTEVGQGFSIKEGTNCKQGVSTLVAGTIVVNNTSVTANSRIFLTTQDPNGGTPGFLWISARTAGTSFTITSSNALDTGIVAYEIFEPS